TVVRSTIVRTPRVITPCTRATQPSITASRSQAPGTLARTACGRMATCSCIKVCPRELVSTGPVAVLRGGIDFSARVPSDAFETELPWGRLLAVGVPISRSSAVHTASIDLFIAEANGQSLDNILLRALAWSRGHVAEALALIDSARLAPGDDGGRPPP